MLGLSEIRQTKVYQEAFTEGLQEGIQEGRQEGEKQAKLQAILRMASYGLTSEAIAQLLDILLETVTEVLKKLENDSSN